MAFSNGETAEQLKARLEAAQAFARKYVVTLSRECLRIHNGEQYDQTWRFETLYHMVQGFGPAFAQAMSMVSQAAMLKVVKDADSKKANRIRKD